MSSFLLPTSDLEEIVLQARSNFLALNGSRIVILGGTGFVGKWLVSALCFGEEVLNLDYDIRIVTRSRQDAAHSLGLPSLEFIEHDLAKSKVDLPVSDYYIHAATPSVPSTGALNSSQVFNATLNGSLSIFNAVEKSKVTKGILYLSSGAVYGRQPIEWTRLPEGTAIVPNLSLNSYGYTKLISESIFAQIHLEKGIPISTPRLFAFYGPLISLHDHFAIGNFLRDARKGGPIRILGNPDTTRSYMYPTDLIINLIHLLVRPESKPINIGSANSLKLIDVAQQLSKMFGDVPIEKLGMSELEGKYVPETDWILKGGGHIPKVGFEEGLWRWNSWLNHISK